VSDKERGAAATAATAEKWWQQDRPAGGRLPRPREGQPCPKCALGDLAFDSLFRLHCLVCGYTADCGAFT
jgi:ribosomal protein S27AE